MNNSAKNRHGRKKTFLSFFAGGGTSLEEKSQHQKTNRTANSHFTPSDDELREWARASTEGIQEEDEHKFVEM